MVWEFHISIDILSFRRQSPDAGSQSSNLRLYYNRDSEKSAFLPILIDCRNNYLKNKAGWLLLTVSDIFASFLSMLYLSVQNKKQETTRNWNSEILKLVCVWTRVWNYHFNSFFATLRSIYLKNTDSSSTRECKFPYMESANTGKLIFKPILQQLWVAKEVIHRCSYFCWPFPLLLNIDAATSEIKRTNHSWDITK